MKSKLTKALAIGSLAASVFLAGILFHKYKFFPYRQLAELAKRKPAHQIVNPTNALSSQYTRDSGKSSFVKDIDTTLLPLKVHGLSVAAQLDFPKYAGAITVISDVVVVVDWLGNIYSCRDGKVLKHPFPELPNNVREFITESGSSLAPSTLRVHDIEFVESSRSLVVAHEYFDKKAKATSLAVSMIEIDPGSMATTGAWKSVFQGDPLAAPVYPGLAGGSRLVSKGSGKLLLSTGDYNQDNVAFLSPKVAQDTNLSFGKILEIDLTTGNRRMVSYGHRNPQGLLFTRTGEIFSTEHGPFGGDELNHIVSGANFGWPVVTLGTDYGTYNWPNSPLTGQHRDYSLPMYAWVPSIGIGNLIQVNGFDQRWDGDLLVASLKASSLFRLRLDGYKVVYAEPIWIGERIRDIAQLKDGTIVLWTDDSRLWFVSIDRQKLETNKRSFDFLPTGMSACMSCHHFGPTNPTHLAPTLTGLLGKKVASDDFSKYSPALKAAGGVWTLQRLKSFISNPNEFANGTSMPKFDFSEQEIDSIVQFLANDGTTK